MSASDRLSAKVEQIIDLTEAMTSLDGGGDVNLIARLSYLAHDLAKQLPPLIAETVTSIAEPGSAG